ncbi:MAG: site-specific DNA-methyltransferase [Gammaproteobacteria bacterium]|nr:site-specific DNA-methyltransferase [Gammaproteobacteria bacterium]MYF01739.1 site-specific DNA-methyltransferase [Gammaproteobacteria bacterium]MYI77349.1 site-specific DNA-methyltransferase [Gammaproteobacteria bacterium]
MTDQDRERTRHRLVLGNATDLKCIMSESVNLVVTSPPYPMIQMWDGVFSEQDSEIERALARGDGNAAFNLMHRLLDKVWNQVDRVLEPGGISCINVGDATRSINEHFALYPNHQRIQQKFLDLGHTCLPSILWRKVTNSPNKFLGSGTMPPSAYVTLEHEWILIFRKGEKRKFQTTTEKSNRLSSSFFWEERNLWFSDVWHLPGTRQSLNRKCMRSRSGAYPFEIPYRLINMFSVKHDRVLDPFVGTGTTTFAAIASERNSIGVEIDSNLLNCSLEQLNDDNIAFMNRYIVQRLEKHDNFVASSDKPMKHLNVNHKIRVVTQQEESINLNKVEGLNVRGTKVTASYSSQALFPISLQQDIEPRTT